MKIKVLICSLVIICLAIAAYGTVAYYSYEDNSDNVITTSNVKIEVPGWAAKNAFAVMPGTEVSKALEVKNIGAQSAWVRIRVETSIELAENVQGQPNASLIVMDYDITHWMLKDGYFYYLKELHSKETTEPLFSNVMFSKEMKNQYQKSQAMIEIKAEATQSVHNGANVFEAAGWPD